MESFIEQFKVICENPNSTENDIKDLSLKNIRNSCVILEFLINPPQSIIKIPNSTIVFLKCLLFAIENIRMNQQFYQDSTFQLVFRAHCFLIRKLTDESNEMPLFFQSILRILYIKQSDENWKELVVLYDTLLRRLDINDFSAIELINNLFQSQNMEKLYRNNPSLGNNISNIIQHFLENEESDDSLSMDLIGNIESDEYFLQHYITATTMYQIILKFTMSSRVGPSVVRMINHLICKYYSVFDVIASELFDYSYRVFKVFYGSGQEIIEFLIGVWTTVSDIEGELKEHHNITMAVSPILISLYIVMLQNPSSRSLFRPSLLRSLLSFLTTEYNDTFPLFFNFCSEHINDMKFESKILVLDFLSLLLHFPQNDMLKRFIFSNYPQILSCTENENESLRQTSLNLVLKSIKRIPQIISTKLEFEAIFNSIHAICHTKQSKSCYKVLQELMKNKISNNFIPSIWKMINATLISMERKDHHFLIVFFSVIDQFVSKTNTYHKELLEYSIKNLSEFPEKSYLFGLISALISHPSEYISSSLKMINEKIIEYLGTDFSNDALDVFSCLICSFPNSVESSLKKIYECLSESTQNPSNETIESVCRVIASLIHKLPGDFRPHSKQYFCALFKILEENQEPNHFYPPIIGVLSEFFSVYPEISFEPYLIYLTKYSCMPQKVSEKEYTISLVQGFYGLLKLDNISKTNSQIIVASFMKTLKYYSVEDPIETNIVCMYCIYESMRHNKDLNRVFVNRHNVLEILSRIMTEGDPSTAQKAQKLLVILKK